ncbi:MAG: glycoside hydrolase family 13 protein [Candidatus Cryosericum sp.]
MEESATRANLWWKTGVMYQCYVRSFMDSNGDGIGDLPGLISKLDVLAGTSRESLGISGLWLSPIYPSPNRDFGYDISDYRAIDPIYGTMEDFEELVAQARQRGIHLIMDLVVNHSSTEHAWFRQARTSRDSPFHDYYMWSEGKGGRPPNNWGSSFGGSAWEWNEQTREFYLHSFLREQADLNWRNPALRKEVHDIMRFWMDRGVDGFRLDVANYYVKDALLRNNPHEFILAQPMPGNPSRILPIPMAREVFTRTVDQPETHEALKEMRRVVDEKAGHMMVGEITQHSLDQVLSYYGNGNDELNLVFNFFFFVRRFRAADFREIVGRTLNGMPPGAWPAWVLSNHDVVRAVSRYHLSPGMAKAMMGVLLTLQGTPFLYNGEPLGLENTPLPRSLLRDPVGTRYWPLPVGRDGERTPMPWDETPDAGFTTGIPWLPLAGSGRNYAAESVDPGSLLNFTKELIRFRSVHPALNAGGMAFVDGPTRNCLCYTRTTSNERVTIMVNLSHKAARLTRKDGTSRPEMLFSSVPAPAVDELGPWEVRITRPS